MGGTPGWGLELRGPLCAHRHFAHTYNTASFLLGGNLFLSSSHGAEVVSHSCPVLFLGLQLSPVGVKILGERLLT